MSRILDAVSRLLPGRTADTKVSAEAKASAVGPLIAWEPLGQPVWAPRDYAAFAREGFMQNAIVYRSVRMIAEAAASVPLSALRGRRGDRRHPLLDLIAHPSPDHTTADFLESWYGFLLVAGNTYRGGGGSRGALARAARLAPRPHEGDPRTRRLARGVTNIPRAGARSLRGRAGGGRAPDPARAPLSSRQRPLRHEPDRGGGQSDRHPQRGGLVEQGAARQCGAAVRRARLRGEKAAI